MVTYSWMWFKNAVNYVLEGDTEVVNYWCSKKFLQGLEKKMKLGDIFVVSWNNDPRYVIESEVIAFGRTEVKGEKIIPCTKPSLNVIQGRSADIITLEKVYNMHIDDKKNLVVGNYSVNLPKVNVVPVDNITLNALDRGMSLMNFIKVVNQNLKNNDVYNPYTSDDPFAYLILRPLKIIAQGDQWKTKERQEEIREFNRKHQAEFDELERKNGIK